MSFRAQICSSPIADITETTRSLPSANPSLICTQGLRTYSAIRIFFLKKKERQNTSCTYRKSLRKTTISMNQKHDQRLGKFQVQFSVLQLNSNVVALNVIIIGKDKIICVSLGNLKYQNSVLPPKVPEKKCTQVKSSKQETSGAK